MATSINAAPYSNLTGFKDISGTSNVQDPVTLPQHLVHIFTYAADGPLEPQMISGKAMLDTYGAQSFEYRSKYCTHATPFINVINGNANTLMLQRLLPADAGPRPTIGFYLDLLQTKIPQYDRNTDGTFKLDANGAKISSGADLTGYVGKWVTKVVAHAQFAQAVKSVGTQTDAAAGTQSTLYPIFEIEYPHFGEVGNLTGVRWWAPTTKSADRLNDSVVLDQRAFLYRLQFLRRDTANSTPNVLKAIDDSQYVNFSFNQDVVDTHMDMALGYDTAILPAYQNLEPLVTESPVYGPAGRFHVYDEALTELLGLIHASEIAHGTVGDRDDDIHLVNIASAVNWDGIPYYTFRLLSVIDGGVSITEDAVHYYTGGSAGTMSNALFDELVANQLRNYGDLDYPLRDTAKYPQSVLYDSGFTLPTKKLFFRALGVRQDISVIVGTQDVSLPQNTQVEESAVAVSLITAASMVPESVLHGTTVCRGMIMGQSGELLNSTYRGILPLTLEIANKLSRYAGAGDGRYVSERAPDSEENNKIELFKNINCTFKNTTVRNKDWANGMNWAQTFDHRSYFIPALQSIYKDDTSVLNSFINVMIGVELNKVAERSWRKLTGNSKLDSEQFIERSNKLIETDAAETRFDNRAIITPNTYFTGYDKVRGYSYSCDITMSANNMITVGSFTIISQRKSTTA